MLTIEAEYKIFGTPTTDGWDLVITKNVENSRATFVGMISNSFGSEGVAGVVDREGADVSLEPIFYNFRGDGVRAVVCAYASTLNEESERLHGFFTELETTGRPKTKLPVNMLFGNFNCNDDENRLAPVDSQISTDVAAKLNPSQLKYAQTALVSKVSTGLGPAGTGKSSMIGALVYDLVANKQERIAATAVTSEFRLSIILFDLRHFPIKRSHNVLTHTTATTILLPLVLDGSSPTFCGYFDGVIPLLELYHVLLYPTTDILVCHLDLRQREPTDRRDSIRRRRGQSSGQLRQDVG